VLLPVPLTISPAFKPSVLNADLEIKLKASWLVCRRECILEEPEEWRGHGTLEGKPCPHYRTPDGRHG
jgi:DsbC/DsbD-like thiol-disulfide interchange protein